MVGIKVQRSQGRRYFSWTLFSRLALSLGFAVSLSAETPDHWRGLVRTALTKLEESQERVVSKYVFRRAGERREFQADGKLKSERTWVVQRVFRDGFFFPTVIERDGKPLSEAELQSNDEWIQKRIVELKAMTPEQRKQLRDEEKARDQQEDAWLRELPDALEFRKAGEEMLNGRAAILLECSPRSGYRARNMRARVFEKTRGRIWIDKGDSEMARTEAEVFEAVNIGWGLLGRIEKGTRFLLSRRKLDQETWGADSQIIRFAVRVMLVKSIHNEVVNRYSGYRLGLEPGAVASSN